MAQGRTDLQERFPDHVVNTWLGQSSRVAERHYLQTTEAHWERAITEPANPIPLPPTVGGNAGGNIPANLPESDAPLNEKIPGNLTAEGSRFPGIRISVPPQGLEPWTR